MCTVCIGMFRKGIVDLYGLIRENNEEVLKDMKVHIALSLKTNPALSIRVWDLRSYDWLYREHAPIRYCPFCGQNLDELDKEIED